VTTLPDPNIDVMKSLQRSLPPGNFMEVPVLDESTGREILNTWLANTKRTLTAQQHQIVMEAFRNDPKPLFLKVGP